MQEMWAQFLGQEDLLEKEMATDSSILMWRIPWTEERGGYSPWGHRRVRHDLGTKQQHWDNRTTELHDKQHTSLFLVSIPDGWEKYQ